MKKYLAVVMEMIWAVVLVWTAVKINFPPTTEQLTILNFFNLQGYTSLWGLRIFSLGILVLTMLLWKKIVERYEISLAKWSLGLIITTPVFLVLVLIHPLVSLKLFLLSLLMYFGTKTFFKKGWILWLVMVVVCVGFNYLILGNRPAIMNQFSLKEAQNEVTARMTEEDSLFTKITLPLWWRRVAYNKYYFIYKNAVSEALPFWDLESVFFQEVHPLDQKSIVMFYWIEIYAFILGIYFLVKKRKSKLNKLIFAGILLSWVDFVFSEGSSYLRLILILFPYSLVIASGFEELRLMSKKKYILAKFSYVILGVILIYGMSINYYDLTVRKEKWFDNRPLAFQFWYEKLAKMDLNQYEQIHVSALVGDSRAYCYFYLGKVCNQDKFIFKSFDLSSENPVINSVYAGFAGEFVGSKFKNDIDPNWQNEVIKRKFIFLESESLADTVAYKYGNDIGLAIKE